MNTNEPRIIQIQDVSDIKFLEGKERTIIHEGKEYKYMSSGNSKECFVDANKEYVVKIAKHSKNDFGDKEVNLNDLISLNETTYNVAHVLLDAIAYEKANENQRSYMAKTEILSNGWIKQEYCKPIKAKRVDLYEAIGVNKEGKIVAYDFELMHNEGLMIHENRNNFHYEKIVNEIELERQEEHEDE